MQRGMLNARGPAVVELLGDVHVTAEVQFATELTVEYLCERLLPLFAFDDLDYSVPALRSEYEQSVARAQEERRRLEEAAIVRSGLSCRRVSGVVRYFSRGRRGRVCQLMTRPDSHTAHPLPQAAHPQELEAKAHNTTPQPHKGTPAI